MNNGLNGWTNVIGRAMPFAHASTLRNIHSARAFRDDSLSGERPGIHLWLALGERHLPRGERLLLASVPQNEGSAAGVSLDNRQRDQQLA